MNFVCNDCSKQIHSKCKGKGSCDCQHRERLV